MAVELGKISTGTYRDATNSTIPINEGVCGLLFDIKGRIFDGFSLASNNFGEDQIQCIHNIAEAEALGIQEYGLMNGIPYYHIKQYYDFIKKDWPLYICFTNASKDGFDIFERMVIESDSTIFQIGVWTNASGIISRNGKLTVSNDFMKYQEKAMVINGTPESPSAYPSGINIIVSAPLRTDAGVDYRNLPNLTTLGYHKLSFLIGQDNSIETRRICTLSGGDVYIGIIGLALGCLTLAYAEENVAGVAKFNLNKDDTLTDMCIVCGEDTTPISEINRVQVARLAMKGYIFPMTYEAKSGGVYLSSDSTMSDGDYGTISTNRVIHKLRRVSKRVLTPMINGRVLFNRNIEYLSDASIAEITNNLNVAIDTYMVNEEGQEQVAGYMPVISNDQKELKNDQLVIGFKLVMLESESVIEFVEKYNI